MVFAQFRDGNSQVLRTVLDYNEGSKQGFLGSNRVTKKVLTFIVASRAETQFSVFNPPKLGFLFFITTPSINNLGGGYLL